MGRELEDQLEKQGVLAFSYSTERLLILGGYSYNAATGSFRHGRERLAVIKGSPEEIATAIQGLIEGRKGEGND